jgi:hypothetical protein
MNLDLATKYVADIVTAGPDIAEANAIELRALREFRKDFEDKQTAAGDIARKLAEGEKKASSLLQLIASKIDEAKVKKAAADQARNKMEEFRQSLLIDNWQEIRKAIKGE